MVRAEPGPQALFDQHAGSLPPSAVRDFLRRRPYARRRVGADALLQAALVGLWEACRKYAPADHGRRFAEWANLLLQRAMREEANPNRRRHLVGGRKVNRPGPVPFSVMDEGGPARVAGRESFAGEAGVVSEHHPDLDPGLVDKRPTARERRLDLLYKALSLLAHKERLVVRRVWLDGETAEAVARSLGVGLRDVRRTLMRSFSWLRDLLAPYRDELEV